MGGSRGTHQWSHSRHQKVPNVPEKGKKLHVRSSTKRSFWFSLKELSDFPLEELLDFPLEELFDFPKRIIFSKKNFYFHNEEYLIFPYTHILLSIGIWFRSEDPVFESQYQQKHDYLGSHIQAYADAGIRTQDLCIENLLLYPLKT